MFGYQGVSTLLLIIHAGFDTSVTAEAAPMLPSAFSSPPISSDLFQSVHDMLCPNAPPTATHWQSLSLKHTSVVLPLDSYRRFLGGAIWDTGSKGWLSTKRSFFLVRLPHGIYTPLFIFVSNRSRLYLSIKRLSS